jgi:predicted Zn-dependent peptidase
MRNRRSMVVLALLLLATAAGAQQVNVREESLPNGMRVLMVERHESPTVACGWVAHVGSVNEWPGVTGISHLFEHMMFKGTKTIGTKDYARDAEIMREQDAVRGEMEKEYAILRRKLRRGEISGNIYDPENMTPRLKELKAQLEGLYAAEKQVIVKDELDQIYTENGASGLNAGTTEDQTLYFVTVPANKLELWFWMESDRLLNPVFREFYSERDVVREERRLRTESTPTGKFDETFDAMFWQSSPYSHPVVGWPSDVESISRTQAERYFSTFYAPNNITAVLVGDFDPSNVMALAARYFGRIPRGAEDPPPMITTEVPQLAEKRFLAEADTNPEVEVRFHAVPFFHKDSFTFELIADLLNRRTGRLYHSLVDGRGVAVGEPAGYFRPLKYEGYFEVDADVKDGHQPEEVEAALRGELTKLAQEPVGERELQKVKNQELADSYRRLQSNFYLMLQLMLYDSWGDWHYINEAPAMLQAVTAADIQRVAQKYFVPENSNVAIFTRKSGSEPVDPEVAALPARLQGMVKQQLAEWATMTDPAELEKDLAQLDQMSGQAPPPVKPAIVLLLKRGHELLDKLRAKPPAGGGASTPPPDPGGSTASKGGN